jgi:gas vesicle protein
MSNNPDEIRADIERTRHELSADVDALAEKASPSRAVHRQGDRVRERMTNIKESIMGSPVDPYSSTSSPGLSDRAQDVQHRAEDMAHEVQHRAEDAVHAVQQAPARVRSGTRGNPLAAGLIALGAGWLVGSLIPASRVEQQTAERVKEQAAPVMDEAKSVAQDMGESLKPQAQEAAASVKDTATTGAEHVKAEGRDQAGQLKDESTQAARHVKGTTERY